MSTFFRCRQRFRIFIRYFNIKYRFFFTNGFKFQQQVAASHLEKKLLKKIWSLALPFAFLLILVSLFYVKH